MKERKKEKKPTEAFTFSFFAHKEKGENTKGK